MIKFLRCITIFLFIYISSNAQIQLPNQTIVTEKFNSLGSSSTAALPANWKMSAAGNGAAATWAGGTNITAVTQGANTGLPTNTGAYNWGTTAGTDRAIGFMTGAGYASPNAIMAWYRNTTGATVNTMTVQFSVERYRINTSAFSLSFFSSTDGTTWTPQAAGDVSAGAFATGASGYTFSNPQTVFRTLTIPGLSVANNGNIYFRWVLTSTTTNGQGIGLDDVAVFAGPSTPVISATLKDRLTSDLNSNRQANAGDKITYSAKIKNTGTGDANNVNYTNLIPATTTISGLVKTSALARNDQYTTPVNTVLNATAVTTNDFGLPSVSIVLFGPTSNPATVANGSNSAVTDNGGTVTMAANGTFTYTPPAGFSGNDKFAYIAGTGTLPNNDAIVTISVGSAAASVNDSYNVIGNVSINPTAGTGILSNDLGGGLVLFAVNGSAANIGVAIATAQGGSLTVNTDGSFSYSPLAGYEGTDQFTYMIDNGFGVTSTATVTLTIGGMIWFIDNNYAGATANGKLGTPFKTLAAFQAVNNGTGNNPASNDHIFLYESATDYTGAVTLLNGQKLIGQDATATLASIAGVTTQSYTAALPAMNSGNPVIVNITTTVAATNAINIAAGASNTLRGFTIGNTTGTGISASGFGTLTVRDLSKNGTGAALILATGACDGILNSITSTSSATAVSLTGLSGSLAINAGSISGSTATAFLVTGGNATITYAGSVSKSSAGRLIDITSLTGGSVNLNGTLSSTVNATGINVSGCTGGTVNFAGTTKTLSTGANTAITLNNNGAATINFSGGGLAVTTSGNTGVNITGGAAAVNITGTGNTISSGNQTALNVASTTIGASGLNFQSITVNGAATGGILLNSTGSLGGLTVTGTGSAGSGGTIQNCVQRGARFLTCSKISLSWMNFTGNGTANIDAAATAGDCLNGTNTNVAAGIDFQTVSGVTLTNVAISGGAQIGLNGKGVTDLVMTNSSVTNAGNENLEDGLQISNLAGTNTITNCSFTGNFHRQFEVQNSTGTMTLTVTGSTFDRNTYVSTAAQGMLIAGRLSAVMTTSVKSSTFRNNFGTAFTGQSIDNANVTFTLGSNGLANTPAEGNTFLNNSLCFQMLSDNAGRLNFNIGNNTHTVTSVVTSGATAFTVRKGTNATGLVTGTIGYNTIGNATAGSGTNGPGTNGLSITNEGLSGGMNITVRNNTIQNVNQRGMEALLQLHDLMSIVAVNNTFQFPSGTGVGHAIFMQSATDPTDHGTLCTEITGNNVVGTWATGNIRVRMSALTGATDVFKIRNLAGITTTDVINFLNVNNTNAQATATTNTSYSGGATACF